MVRVESAQGQQSDAETEIAIIGAGAAGLTAALAAVQGSDDVLVLERDTVPAGSTALSSGFVPAAGTRAQGVSGDSAEIFAQDIARKAKGLQDAGLTRLATETIAPVLDWLGAEHGLDWQVLDSFLYPGHSYHRMHAVPEKTGAGLMARLQAAASAAGVAIATNARVDVLYRDGDRITGLGLERPDGTRETIACQALILACNGYGGNPDLVAQHLPDMRDALYFGHAGNQGEAVIWGQQLGAQLQHLSGYQGHGSVAVHYGILITWALMMEGGVQVNLSGTRFSDETGGYSEQAVHVLAQPDKRAFNIYDARTHELGLGFPDYRQAVEMGAVKSADTPEQLALRLGIDASGLAATLGGLGQGDDPFGRDFNADHALQPPYFGIEVTGALFHTQGGLRINDRAQVLTTTGQAMPNLFAAGGAACGVSGPDVSGYLSGNGLLTAFAFGALAGRNALGQD